MDFSWNYQSLKATRFFTLQIRGRPLNIESRPAALNLDCYKPSGVIKMNRALQFAFLSCIILAVVANEAHAQDQKSSTEKLLSIMGVERQMKAGFEAMLPMIDRQASSLNLTASEKKELKNIYRSWFRDDIDRERIIEEYVNLYEEVFSSNEIEELISFYQSPVGRKFLQESPRLMQLGVKIGMEEARAKEYLLNQRLQPFLDLHVK